MTYEDLLKEADSNNITVVEKSFKSNAKGLCKGNKIGIRYNMLETEKVCILAEELGHYHTSVGDILDQSSTANVKQEHRARAWAYGRLVPIEEIRFAIRDGYHELYDMAEYLSVDEDFLRDSIEHYRRKYGDDFTDHFYLNDLENKRHTV